MPFYEYDQNNSGGSFVYDDVAGISEYVIVEARSAHVANAIAEEIGLYFDGDGDCQCCGDRWYSAGDDSWRTDTSFPSINGTPVEEYSPNYVWRTDGGPAIYVHYEDGRIEGFGGK